ERKLHRAGRQVGQGGGRSLVRYMLSLESVLLQKQRGAQKRRGADSRGRIVELPGIAPQVGNELREIFHWDGGMYGQDQRDRHRFRDWSKVFHDVERKLVVKPRTDGKRGSR